MMSCWRASAIAGVILWLAAFCSAEELNIPVQYGRHRTVGSRFGKTKLLSLNVEDGKDCVLKLDNGQWSCDTDNQDCEGEDMGLVVVKKKGDRRRLEAYRKGRKPYGLTALCAGETAYFYKNPSFPSYFKPADENANKDRLALRIEQHERVVDVDWYSQYVKIQDDIKTSKLVDRDTTGWPQHLRDFFPHLKIYDQPSKTTLRRGANEEDHSFTIRGFEDGRRTMVYRFVNVRTRGQNQPKLLFLRTTDKKAEAKAEAKKAPKRRSKKAARLSVSDDDDDDDEDDTSVELTDTAADEGVPEQETLQIPDAALYLIRKADGMIRLVTEDNRNQRYKDEAVMAAILQPERRKFFSMPRLPRSKVRLTIDDGVATFQTSKWTVKLDVATVDMDNGEGDNGRSWATERRYN